MNNPPEALQKKHEDKVSTETTLSVEESKTKESGDETVSSLHHHETIDDKKEENRSPRAENEAKKFKTETHTKEKYEGSDLEANTSAALPDNLEQLHVDSSQDSSTSKFASEKNVSPCIEITNQKTTSANTFHVSEATEHPQPISNRSQCSKNFRHWQPPPFFKSQSLELCNETTFLSNIIQQRLNFKLPEITEARSIVDQDTPTQSTISQNPELVTQASGSKAVLTEPTGTVRRPNMPGRHQMLESRPIYPNVPYSPYASPYQSPRIIRRRTPLRESRRISIEQSGSFLQLNQYKLLDQIGQGSYGLVKLAYSEEDSTHYAMKILSKRKLLRQAGLMRRGPKKATTPLDRVYREIAVLKKLDHPNIVKLIEVLDDPMEDSLYMVFELVKQGEVLIVPTKDPLTEQRALNVFRDTLLGLEYLHYQKIIHADLKPGNLLMTEDDHVKIADLGVCNEFLGDDATMTNVSTAGTPAFRAPETLSQGQLQYCGKAADIWALGATLYSLVFGNVPFVAQSVPVLYERIKNEDVNYPLAPKISDELRDCIKRMLTKDPEERISLSQLKEHAWVTTGGKHPLPTEDENCLLVQVNDEDINSVVRSIPKLDTLILIKTMLKKHSFGNPFPRGGSAQPDAGSRLERFARSGRSNSAPGAYDVASERPRLSSDEVLTSLTEDSSSPTNDD